MQVPWPSTSTLVGPVTSVSENASLSQTRGKRGKTPEERVPQEYIGNLRKSSMIDGENRAAKITVIVFFACRYDSGEQNMIFSSKKRNF